MMHLQLLVSGVFVALALSAPTDVSELTTDKPGLTHEEYLEYLALDTTDGWEPMSRVPIYNFTSTGEIIGSEASNVHLIKRKGRNQWDGYSGFGCDSKDHMMSMANFGCGACLNVPDPDKAAGRRIMSGHLWREKNGNPYPTADWYSSPNCGGGRKAHQGILSGQHDSCNGFGPALSVMLYQGC